MTTFLFNTGGEEAKLVTEISMHDLTPALLSVLINLQDHGHFLVPVQDEYGSITLANSKFLVGWDT